MAAASAARSKTSRRWVSDALSHGMSCLSWSSKGASLENSYFRVPIKPWITLPINVSPAPTVSITGADSPFSFTVFGRVPGGDVEISWDAPLGKEIDPLEPHVTITRLGPIADHFFATSG